LTCSNWHGFLFTGNPLSVLFYARTFKTNGLGQKGLIHMRLFRILIIGDIFGKPGCNILRKLLPDLKNREAANFCIVNGENSADNNGIDSEACGSIFTSGADVITTGNHAFDRKTSLALFEQERVLRPANFHPDVPGHGVCMVDCGAVQVRVINLCGAVFMNPVQNPFDMARELLNKKYDSTVSILDFHAEATSEKRAMGLWLDGKITCVYGTHTHVQTADEEILPGGTAYITDIGMTGPAHSIIGLDPATAIPRLRTGLSKAQKPAEGPCLLSGIVVTADAETGKAIEIKRILIRE